MKESVFSFNAATLQRKTIILTFILILLISIISQIFISNNFSKIIDKKIESKKDMTALLYNKFIKETFDIQRAIIHESLSSNDIKKAILSHNRALLKQTTYPQYKAMSNGFPYLNVMHFVTNKNISYLRLHRLEKYADDLSKVRPMHVLANKSLETLQGMEVGKYGISLRSVSPVIYDKKHFGTLEVGTALENIVKELKETMNIEILLTLKNSKLKVSLLESLKKYDNKSSILFASKLFRELHPKLKNGIRLNYKKHNYIIYKGIDLFSFNGDKVGEFFYAIDISNELHEKTNYIILSSIITALLLFFIYIILHVNLSKMSEALSIHAGYSQLILNSQKNILILTDGVEMVDANQSFLDFFSYKSVKEFKARYQCVCDFFQPCEKPNFIQGKYYKNIRWTDYLLEHPDEDLNCKIIIDSEEYIFSLSATATQIDSKTLRLISLTDVTCLMNENENLHRLSYTDKLTQVNNRQSFDMIISKLHKKSKKDNFIFSIIFFDIDHFKKVNDTYGHDTGDEVLKSITSLVKSHIRSNDILFRWGGEEFIIILPKIKLNTAYEIAQKLRKTIEDEKIDVVGKVTCSFGVSQSNHSKDVTSLIKDADTALYRAKNGGRNRVESTS